MLAKLRKLICGCIFKGWTIIINIYEIFLLKKLLIKR